MATHAARRTVPSGLANAPTTNRRRFGSTSTDEAGRSSPHVTEPQLFSRHHGAPPRRNVERRLRGRRVSRGDEFPADPAAGSCFAVRYLSVGTRGRHRQPQGSIRTSTSGHGRRPTRGRRPRNRRKGSACPHNRRRRAVRAAGFPDLVERVAPIDEVTLNVVRLFRPIRDGRLPSGSSRTPSGIGMGLS